jgi:hypothetical protein
MRNCIQFVQFQMSRVRIPGDDVASSLNHMLFRTKQDSVTNLFPVTISPNL